MDEFITVAEAAQLLGVGRRTVFNYIARGKLTGYQSGVGNRTMVRRADVDALREVRPRVPRERAS